MIIIVELEELKELKEIILIWKNQLIL